MKFMFRYFQYDATEKTLTLTYEKMAMHFHIASHCQTCTLRPPASLPPVHWAASPDTPATLEAVVEVAKFTYKKFGKFLKVGIQIPKFLWSCERPGWGLSRFNHPSYSTNGWRLCQRCCLKKSGWFSSEKKVPMMSHSTGWLKGDLYHHVYIYITWSWKESPPCKWLDAVQLHNFTRFSRKTCA